MWNIPRDIEDQLMDDIENAKYKALSALSRHGLAVDSVVEQLSRDYSPTGKVYRVTSIHCGQGWSLSVWGQTRLKGGTYGRFVHFIAPPCMVRVIAPARHTASIIGVGGEHSE